MDDSASQRHGQGANDHATAAHQRELDACLTTAKTLHEQGHFDAAKQLYLSLLNVNPEHFEATRLLGVMADQLGQYDIACDLLARTTQQQPQNVDALFHHALALQHAGRPDHAAPLYAQALTLAPNNAQIAENLTVALLDTGQELAAIEACEHALTLNAESALAHSNLGKIYFNRGATKRARHHFEHLRALHPALGEAHEKMATVQLRERDYVRGFESYEWRFADTTSLSASPPRHGAYPTWSGDDLGGRTILVTPEQGVGDEVMFASCVPDLIAAAGHVVIQCDDRLHGLFARSFPAATVVGDAPPPTDIQIDCCVSIASLPRFFRASSNAFHGRPFLVADSERVDKWRTELAASDADYSVGVSWRAGRHARAQHARSIDLSRWRAVFESTRSPIVNVQYGDHAAEMARCVEAGMPIPESLAGIDPLLELEDFAALIVALDLVITVDNSTAHLAGALGVPTWVLLPAGAEWRWGEGTSEALWYDSVRLFRQSVDQPGDWQPPLEAVAQALREFVPSRRVCAKPGAELSQIVRRDPPSDAHVVVLNDTRNWYHFGCTGTSLALHHALRKKYRSVAGVPITATMDLAGVPDTLAGFKDAAVAEAFCREHAPLLATLASADHIYVNGEGTLHDRSPAACGLLYLAWLAATRLGKSVSIINHSAYPGDEQGRALYREVYQSMACIAVREPVSARAMRSLGLDVIQSFDSLPLYIDELYQRKEPGDNDYVVLAGGVTWHEGAAPAVRQFIAQMAQANLEVVVLVGARAYPASEEMRFAEAVLREHGAAVRMVCAFTESEWLDTIDGAKLLVSGRFHHSIAAAFLDTPLVASGSNTPKMQGLMDACELPEPIAAPADWGTNDAHRFARELCARAAQAMNDSKALRLTPAVRARLITAAKGNVGSPQATSAALGNRAATA